MTASIAETSTTIHSQQLVSPETTNPLQIKWVAFEVPATADDGDEVTITLATYGITTLWDIMVWTHTTTDSVIITEASEINSSVVAGTLTVTIPGSTDNKKRVIMVGGV